jgi:hypothetical protein
MHGGLDRFQRAMNSRRLPQSSNRSLRRPGFQFFKVVLNVLLHLPVSQGAKVSSCQKRGLKLIIINHLRRLESESQLGNLSDYIEHLIDRGVYTEDISM